MAAMTTYTKPLNAEQCEKLRNVLKERGFEFEAKQWCLFAASKGKLNVLVYAKGPKVVIQGKETAEFVSLVLEPLVLGRAELGYEEVNQPEMFEPHIGIDESGKGDFFGPLVVAGVYVDAQAARHLLDAGVMDSKRISSDARIATLRKSILEAPGIATEVLLISPHKYNELQAKFGNLNRLLAWAHSTVLENLLEKQPECPTAISDQFANPEILRKALKQRGKGIELIQRTKAESDLAVAAASILARYRFVTWLKENGERLGAELPKGVSEAVKERARMIVRDHGKDTLSMLVKTHFRTYTEVV